MSRPPRRNEWPLPMSRCFILHPTSDTPFSAVDGIPYQLIAALSNSFVDTTADSIPIARQCSGLVQSIFSPPSRRSAPFMIWVSCRRAAGLKMLCTIPCPGLCRVTWDTSHVQVEIAAQIEMRLVTHSA